MVGFGSISFCTSISLPWPMDRIRSDEALGFQRVENEAITSAEDSHSGGPDSSDQSANTTSTETTTE